MGPKRPRKGRMRQSDIFQTPPPPNETLSHSNGKVVFDHGPKFYDKKNVTVTSIK